MYEFEEALDRVDTTFKLNVKGTTNFGAALALIGRITSEAGPGTGQSLLHVYYTLLANLYTLALEQFNNLLNTPHTLGSQGRLISTT